MSEVVNKKYAIERWKKLCETIQNSTVVNPNESVQEKDTRIAHLLQDYNSFVEYYFPHYTTNSKTGENVANAPFHTKAANKVRKERNLKAAFVWHRGAAKSTHFDIFIPLWLKALGEIHVFVLVGKSEDNAQSLLGDLQAELQYNQRYIHDFGTQYNAGSWEDGNFITADGAAFFARGRGQSPRGLRYRSNRPDYIVCDDIDDDELSQNPSRVGKITDWVKEALFGALDIGRGRFIMVGNLISKNSVLAKISEIKSVYVSQVNILGKNGNVSWPEKYTRKEVQELEEFMGYRSFQKEEMNNPIVAGAVFHQTWIRFAKRPLLKKFSEFVLYIDPSWKGTAKNDYKAAKLWGKCGEQLWHLRAFVRQCSVAEMVRWCYDLYEFAKKDSIAIHFYMEANFMQDAILYDFRTEGSMRGYQLPISADKRKKPDKFQRIESISPLWERGFVMYDESQKDDPDMKAGIEQTLSFQKGMCGHDDAPDADEGAIMILQIHNKILNFTPSFGKRHNAKNISW